MPAHHVFDLSVAGMPVPASHLDELHEAMQLSSSTASTSNDLAFGGGAQALSATTG
jgi:hypothetical protein